MRLHWLSNAPWTPTGYGNQTNLFLWRLIAAGHEVSGCSVNYGLQGAPLVLNGITFYPTSHDQFLSDVLVPDYQHSGADLMVILYNLWAMNPDAFKKVPTAGIAPVEHQPMTRHDIESLKAVTFPIAMAEFARDEMLRVGLDPLYVPHAVDAAKYYPMPQAEAREKIGVPKDGFIAALVAANKGAPSRKAFEPQLRAFKRLADQHSDAFLLLHTDVLGLNNGEPLLPMIEALGIPQNRVILPDPYMYNRGLYNEVDMRQRYSAADVLLHCTRGEGFGVTQIEAMACGVPVISTNFTAMPEIVKRGAGWLVDPCELLWMPQGSYQAIVPSAAILEALAQAYDKRGDQAMRDKAVAGMKAHYDIEVVMEKHMLPALDTIADRLGKPRLQRQVVEVAA